MPLEPTLTLYHMTNRSSADRMLTTGLGLTLDDYVKLYAQVKDYFNLPDELLSDIHPESVPEVESGVVCLYSSLTEALEAVDLARVGGLYRGAYVERLVRRCGGHLAVPLTQLEQITQTLVGGLSEPVVVVVGLHPSEVTEPSKIKGSSGIRSRTKIPASAILKVLSVV